MLERSLSAETQCPTAQGRAQGAGAPSAQDASSSTTRPPRSCETCPVRLPGFCGRLGGGLQVLAEESKRVDLPAGATVWDEHRGGLVVGILVRGMLRSVYHGQDGRRHVMSLVFPGELIGSHLMRPSLSLEAVLDSRLCRLSGSAYARLAARAPGFRDLIREQTEADLERLRYLTLALGALNPEQRLASFLSLMIKVMPWQPYPSGGGMLTVLLPRADIADLLAISVESISRTTHRWERDGLIRISDPRRFEIPDPDRLADVGELDSQFRRLSLFGPGVSLLGGSVRSGDDRSEAAAWAAQQKDRP